MILAAGSGTRLGALTGRKPKPMLPVCGAPLVRWAVLWLRAQGIREIVINLHHLGEQIEAELGGGGSLGVDIAYSREEKLLLGTGGGLRQARPLLDDGRGTPIVVVNGKILLELDLASVLDLHRRLGAEATMVLRADPDAQHWGSLELGEDGRVSAFLGERRAGQPSREPLMFTGVHVLEPRFLDRIPADGAPCIVRTAYASLFREGRGPHGFVTDRYWWEHSTVERYIRGVANVLDGKVSLPHAEGPLVGVDPGARVDETAEVRPPVWIGEDVVVGARARIGPHVQIGQGARVEAGCRLERAVLWEGARVGRDVRDEVVP